MNTGQWLDVVGTAHAAGLRTTATIMFGHLVGDRSGLHLMRMCDLQSILADLRSSCPCRSWLTRHPCTNGAGPARDLRSVKHCSCIPWRVSRSPPGSLNIQMSWVKMGPAGFARGAAGRRHDLGGTLMNKSISRAAGAVHGQEMTVGDMRALATSPWLLADGTNHAARATEAAG